MDREAMGCKTIYNRYVIDDGWKLPVEVVEDIELRVQMAWKDAYKKVCREHKLHQGDWLTEDVARKIEAKSWIYRELYDYQYVAEVRKMGQELQKQYGVTELEAINILNGLYIKEYVNKYYRIKHRIPLAVNEQAICDEVVDDYMAMAM